jgi:hypothetical protein
VELSIAQPAWNGGHRASKPQRLGTYLSESKKQNKVTLHNGTQGSRNPGSALDLLHYYAVFCKIYFSVFEPVYKSTPYLSAIVHIIEHFSLLIINACLCLNVGKIGVFAM